MTLDILMPGMSGFDVLEEVRVRPGAAAARRWSSCRSTRGGRRSPGEWTVAKPIDAEQLTDALGSAVLAGRTRVLVVGRESVKSRLEPSLERLGLDHDWATSGATAARMCQEHRYEVALVDAGMRSPQTVLRALDLRGRRLRRAVLLFTTGQERAGIVATLEADPVPIEEAATAVLQVLSHDGRGISSLRPCPAPKPARPRNFVRRWSASARRSRRARRRPPTRRTSCSATQPTCARRSRRSARGRRSCATPTSRPCAR